MTPSELFTYLLPPLLGAVIGYVTNYVAIRMLFRPLRAWRLFGLRIPMTPGIIPARRGELAARMGEMVGRHLLTPADVGKALDQPAFQRELKAAVADKLGLFLDRELGPLASLVPSPYRGRFVDLVAVGSGKLATIVIAYLHSAEFESRLRQFVRDKSHALLALDLERCVTPQQYDALHRHADTLLSGYLASEPLADSVAQFVDAKTAQWLRSEKPLRSLLPEDLVDLLLEHLEKEVPPLLEKFGGLLYDPDFRQRLTVRIRQGIEKFLDSLGGLAGLLSGFVNLDKVYAKIPDTLDQISEEVARWLKEEKTRAQIAGLLRERVAGVLDRPLAHYVERLPYEKVDGVRQFLGERAIALLHSRRTAEALLGLAGHGVQSIKGRPFVDLLDDLLPEQGRERALLFLEEKLLTLARSDRTATGLREVIDRQVRILFCEKPLGRLASKLPADVNEELEEVLYQQLVEVLKKEIPVLVDALKIQQLVEAKVNSLDLLEVESLLLGVMQEQFKYINLFGALLGFLIGLLNALVLYFRPF